MLTERQAAIQIASLLRAQDPRGALAVSRLKMHAASGDAWAEGVLLHLRTLMDASGNFWLPYLGGFAFGTLQSIYDSVREPKPEQVEAIRAFADTVRAARRQDASGSWFWPALLGFTTQGVLDLTRLVRSSLERPPVQVAPYNNPYEDR